MNTGMWNAFARESEMQNVLAQAVATLADRSGVAIRLIDFSPYSDGAAPHRADATITLRIRDRRIAFDVEFKARMQGRASVDVIADRQAGHATPLLLVAPYLSMTLAEQCVQRGLRFIDLAGNAYLSDDSTHICIIGKKPNETTLHDMTIPPALRAGGNASSLRLTFVVLSRPDLLNCSYRELATISGIALGAVGTQLGQLRERGHLVDDARFGRRIVARSALRDEWVTNFPLRLLPKLNAMRFRAENPDWWRDAELGANQAWWSGEVAAATLANAIRPATQTVYVKPEIRREWLLTQAKRHRLRADPAGPIEILDAFWDFGEYAETTEFGPSLLVYADLVRSRDPRNVEASQVIRSLMESNDAKAAS
ncbi:hypothetical protein PTE30175_02046 [Pandoraea terrae]|uniref:Transcriptional regulator n=1 Tax=Pandoraea terrae TaxID=1537710 RepID=A0A5E4UMP4_9BURK|nr:type IV toxin-antitoxin system AbiEi family antitoxin [Pandoraea terrae]VVE00813.1 hypothetical protein PTE30175_02046 [Pandoraea terrae]